MSYKGNYSRRMQSKFTIGFTRNCGAVKEHHINKLKAEIKGALLRLNYEGLSIQIQYKGTGELPF